MGALLPKHIIKERFGSLSRVVERFAFHVAFVKIGLGSLTRYVEQETSPFELKKRSTLGTILLSLFDAPRMWSVGALVS